MATNKTVETQDNVAAFIATIKDEKRRADVAAISAIMAKASGLDARMWGTAIIGFGSYHYKYDSGHEGDAPLAGLASRAAAIVLYLSLEPDERETMLAQLGKHKTGKGCIYVQKLADIDTAVLTRMVKASAKNLKTQYPG